MVIEDIGDRKIEFALKKQNLLVGNAQFPTFSQYENNPLRFHN